MIDRLPPDLSGVRRLCEARAPHEACGVILHGPAGFRVVELANALVQDDPAAARTAYAFDPAEQLRVFSEAQRRGERLVVIFHSHVGVPAAFSPRDRADAAPGGVPLFPGVLYLILEISGGVAVDAQVHGWDGPALRSVRVPAPFWRTA